MIDPKVLLRVTEAIEEAERYYFRSEWGWEGDEPCHDLGQVPREFLAHAALTEVRKIQIEEQEQIARIFDSVHSEFDDELDRIWVKEVSEK